MATLPGAWHYRISAGTGRPGVSILWVGEMESLICNLCLSVAARKIKQICPRDTLACCWDIKQPTNNNLRLSLRLSLSVSLSGSLCVCLSVCLSVCLYISLALATVPTSSPPLFLCPCLSLYLSVPILGFLFVCTCLSYRQTLWLSEAKVVCICVSTFCKS